MGWEKCRGKRYFIIRQQMDNKKIRVSCGPGERGKVAEQAYRLEQDKIKQQKFDAKRLDSLAKEYELLVDLEVAQTLISEGFEKRNNRWVRAKDAVGGLASRPPKEDNDSATNPLLDQLDAEIRKLCLEMLELSSISTDQVGADEWPGRGYLFLKERSVSPISKNRNCWANRESSELPITAEDILAAVDQMQTSLQNESDHPIQRLVQRQATTFWLLTAACALRTEEENPMLRIQSPFFWLKFETQANNRFLKSMELLLRLRKLSL